MKPCVFFHLQQHYTTSRAHYP